MTERTRREFLSHIAALLAATAAGTTGLGQALSPAAKGENGQPPFVGIQMSPHTMLYEGIGPCLDLVQRTAAVNMVLPYSHAFHTNSLGQPVEELAPDHGKPPRDFRHKVPMVWVSGK